METNSSSLRMVQLQLDAARLMRHTRGLKLGPRHEDLGYLVHAAMAALFGEGVVQPFSIRGEMDRRPVVLGYTSKDRSALQQHAETYADPGFYEACDWETLACKPMPGQWGAGARLGFEIRLCPVVRLANDLAAQDPAGGPQTYKKGAEMDAWLNRRLRNPDDRSVSREQAYVDWFQQRLGKAARLSSVTLRRFRRLNLVRRKQEAGRPARTLERPEALLTGGLQIEDPEAFSRLLHHGIGRHKAFGFGMLLLRPE